MKREIFVSHELSFNLPTNLHTFYSLLLILDLAFLKFHFKGGLSAKMVKRQNGNSDNLYTFTAGLHNFENMKLSHCFLRVQTVTRGVKT